jgi:hypothetical protein
MCAEQDVVGINTEHKGLSVRLLRSASLLGMMHLYRFGFVVGILQVNERPTISPPTPYWTILMLILSRCSHIHSCLNIPLI